MQLLFRTKSIRRGGCKSGGEKQWGEGGLGVNRLYKKTWVTDYFLDIFLKIGLYYCLDHNKNGDCGVHASVRGTAESDYGGCASTVAQL